MAGGQRLGQLAYPFVSPRKVLLDSVQLNILAIIFLMKITETLEGGRGEGRSKCNTHSESCLRLCLKNRKEMNRETFDRDC